MSFEKERNNYGHESLYCDFFNLAFIHFSRFLQFFIIMIDSRSKKENNFMFSVHIYLLSENLLFYFYFFFSFFFFREQNNIWRWWMQAGVKFETYVRSLFLYQNKRDNFSRGWQSRDSPMQPERLETWIKFWSYVVELLFYHWWLIRWKYGNNSCRL